RALADPVLLEWYHFPEELAGVLAVNHDVVVTKHDELAERPELTQHFVGRPEAHGGSVCGRDAAELTGVGAAAHRLHDLKRDVLSRAEQIATRIGSSRQAR